MMPIMKKRVSDTIQLLDFKIRKRSLNTFTNSLVHVVYYG